MSKNWMITGGCGFLGRNLIQYLLADTGHRIRVVDNLSVGTRQDLEAVCDFEEISTASLSGESAFPKSKVQLVVGDLLDPQLALNACRGFDVIVHLAANTGVGLSVSDPRTDCHTNVLGTLNVLEAARHNGTGRFIFASSGAAVGNARPPIHEELAPHPASPYGAGKLAGEAYCLAYFNSYRVETVSLRFGNVYGPLSGLKNSVVAKFIKRAMKGEALEIYGDGDQTRDFIFVDDLIDAVYRASTAPDASGQIFQIATGRETSVNEMVEVLLPVLADCGIAAEVTHGPKQAGEVMRNYSDTAKARRILGWTPTTSLESGLRKTVSWFVSP